MVVFNKNALEVAVKVKIFKKYDVGLQSDYQVAMLANLSFFFLKCKLLFILIITCYYWPVTSI